MKTFREFMNVDEAFKPMNEPKMQNQMKRHLKRDNDKRERGEGGRDDRLGNMRAALNVIGSQQKSKGFKEKKTEKGRKTAAKSNADNFLLRDKWNASQQVRGRKPTVPNRHITRDEEGHKKHLDRLKKSGVGESYDYYDIILSHLLDEGYAETVEAAEVIMVNMSEDWRESIVEEVLDEAIRNPESRKKLRDIEDKEVRKGDKSKGENPRSKYSTDKGKLAGHLLRGPESTGSKGNPVRSRGGTNAPADERVGRGPHRAGNAAYWAGNAGPNRDRGAGNKSARRAGKSVPNTRDED